MELQPLTGFQLWSNNMAKTTSVLMTKCYHIVLCPYFSPWVVFLRSIFYLALRVFPKRRKHVIFWPQHIKGCKFCEAPRMCFKSKILLLLAKAFRMGQGGLFYKVFCGQRVMKKKCWYVFKWPLQKYLLVYVWYAHSLWNANCKCEYRQNWIKTGIHANICKQYVSVFLQLFFPLIWTKYSFRLCLLCLLNNGVIQNAVAAGAGGCYSGNGDQL